MVTFAVRDSTAPVDGPHEVLSFSERHIWHPAVPDQRLSFMGTESIPRPLKPYCPFTTALFGGQEGQHLRHIRRVMIWTREAPRGPEKWQVPYIHGIEFLYDDLGEKTSVLLGNPSRNDAQSKVYHMDIDSHNGERIIQLDALYVYRFTSNLFGVRVREPQRASKATS